MSVNNHALASRREKPFLLCGAVCDESLGGESIEPFSSSSSPRRWNQAVKTRPIIERARSCFLSLAGKERTNGPRLPPTISCREWEYECISLLVHCERAAATATFSSLVDVRAEGEIESCHHHPFNPSSAMLHARVPTPLVYREVQRSTARRRRISLPILPDRRARRNAIFSNESKAMSGTSFALRAIDPVLNPSESNRRSSPTIPRSIFEKIISLFSANISRRHLANTRSLGVSWPTSPGNVWSCRQKNRSAFSPLRSSFKCITLRTNDEHCRSFDWIRSRRPSSRSKSIFAKRRKCSRSDACYPICPSSTSWKRRARCTSVPGVRWSNTSSTRQQSRNEPS